MKNKQEKSVLEHLGQSIRKSVIVKIMSIFILMLLLMIPISYIQMLIQEREDLQQSTINEVSNKWAKEQHVYGPILTIPFKKKILIDEKVNEVRYEVHMLPSVLNINGTVDPHSLHRGIYEVVVYDSKISFAGNFSDLDKHLNEHSENEIIWEEAFLTINISDLSGINEKIIVGWNGSDIPVEPGTHIPELIKSGITVSNIFEENPSGHSFDFGFTLQLQGSQYLGFIPLGKETRVNITSDWQNPSFSGSFLPNNRTINEHGFIAEYKILELNRNYPQFWIGDQNEENIRKSAFGVDLLLPVNDYQKATRSTKYALLAISLTFLTFFLIEVFNKNEMHPFQYVLIGLALCLFYILLVSISEQTNFNTAYLISSISVIAMIGLYAKSILQSVKQTIVLVLILCLIYAFVYITLQIQDYALLIGSIGLTVILAFTMYITRHINWYDLSSVREPEIS